MRTTFPVGAASVMTIRDNNIADAYPATARPIALRAISARTASARPPCSRMEPGAHQAAAASPALVKMEGARASRQTARAATQNTNAQPKSVTPRFVMAFKGQNQLMIIQQNPKITPQNPSIQHQQQ